MATIAADNGDFLKDGSVKMDYKYLGSPKPKDEDHNISVLTIATCLTVVLLIGFLLQTAYRFIYARVARDDAKSSVQFDCEQAILKKYKLES